jgi:microcystin-dependent protein
MAEPFIGEVRIFPYGFPPYQWAWCNGQSITIQQNQALFSIVANRYGGDGRTVFALPDLRGRAPMHWGSGPGLTPRQLAQTSGSATVTLNQSQLPNHDHTAQASMQSDGKQSVPTTSSYPALMIKRTGTASQAAIYGYRAPDANATLMAVQALSVAGQTLGHENRQPCLGLYFCIALDGMYPMRNG